VVGGCGGLPCGGEEYIRFRCLAACTQQQLVLSCRHAPGCCWGSSDPAFWKSSRDEGGRRNKDVNGFVFFQFVFIPPADEEDGMRGVILFVCGVLRRGGTVNCSHGSAKTHATSTATAACGSHLIASALTPFWQFDYIAIAVFLGNAG